VNPEKLSLTKGDEFPRCEVSGNDASYRQVQILE
jgi:hypothetical protein